MSPNTRAKGIKPLVSRHPLLLYYTTGVVLSSLFLRILKKTRVARRGDRSAGWRTDTAESEAQGFRQGGGLPFSVFFFLMFCRRPEFTQYTAHAMGHVLGLLSGCYYGTKQKTPAHNGRHTSRTWGAPLQLGASRSGRGRDGKALEKAYKLFLTIATNLRLLKREDLTFSLLFLCLPSASCPPPFL